ncbi:hypothetical protein BS50DRAFT_234378 [Corynespora cassiicola Philippines]|uniref:Uncharacterized protein n=1 Tax=Corynespora cassiicola Philippines TaxID=1448308 RepID=A0A2T2P1Z7_CORCC|nr:hypothetical protein BS50DRAFT_234378 [Corynespora cassiicola Philippines]
MLQGVETARRIGASLPPGSHRPSCVVQPFLLSPESCCAPSPHAFCKYEIIPRSLPIYPKTISGGDERTHRCTLCFVPSWGGFCRRVNAIHAALRCCGDGLFVSPDVFEMTLLALRLHLVTWPVPAHSLITAVQTPTWPRCGAGFVVFWNQRAAEANAARSRCASIYGQLNMPVFDCEPRRSELRCLYSFQCYAGNKEKKVFY